MTHLQLPAISSIAQTIQLAIAPVFLLAGIGAILNVVASRLARVVDRSRALSDLYSTTEGPEHTRIVWELRLLDRRMGYANAAIALCVGSAVMVCLLVALLFVTQIVGLPYRAAVAVCFILAMLLLIAGLLTFLYETRLARRAIRVREELLEREEAERRWLLRWR